MPALGLPKPQTLISKSLNICASLIPLLTPRIVTCVDPRILPEKFLDLGPSKSNTINELRETSGILTAPLEIVGPLIIRNVCGHVAPAMEDIVSLDYLLHFRDILIIQHTGKPIHTFGLSLSTKVAYLLAYPRLRRPHAEK